MKFNSFIVGQGLAGSVLALTLQHRGHKVKLFDRNQGYSSSMVAAGLFNPITGKRQSLTWRAHELFDCMHVFYTTWQRQWERLFFHPMPVYKILTSIADQNQWASRQSDPIYSSFLGKQIMHKLKEDVISNPFECLHIARGGWVNIPIFLSLAKTHFERTGDMETADVNLNSFVRTNGKFHWHDNEAENLIFCHGAFDSELWDNLPFTPMKGEILTIRCPGLTHNGIVIGGCFMIPMGNDLYRVGATFNWRDRDFKPTEEARLELIDKLEKFLKLPYTIINHEVGIRPTVYDRKPLLGEHPNHKNVYILNGLGSKGVSIAPLMAEWLSDFICKGKPLPEEVNLNRFL